MLKKTWCNDIMTLLQQYNLEYKKKMFESILSSFVSFCDLVLHIVCS